MSQTNTVQNSAPEAGKIYKVTHSRKGIFTMRVDSVGEVWAQGVIVEGKANALLAYNEKFEGEPITVRIAFCKFTEVSDGQD